MKKPLYQFLLFLILIPSPYLAAQISVGGLPYSLVNYKNGRVQQLASTVNNLENIDNKDELEKANEIARSCEQCGKEYYGVGLDVIVNIKKDGFVTVIPEGKIWKYTFSSTSAYGMQFYFNDYKLPKKASLFIYNQDQTEILGAFTHINNHPDNKFATQIINGSDITLEYFEADDVEFSGVVSIYKVIHVFKENIHSRQLNSPSGKFGDSESCNLDINCDEGASFQNEKTAVCRISYYDYQSNLAGWCSGFLVNSNQIIKNAYLITANHCLGVSDYSTPGTSANTRFSEWIFEFDFEKKPCGSSIQPTTHSHQGATLVTRSTDADYALLDLNVNHIENYLNVNYLGWDKRDNVTFTNNIGIHHPEGDVKKLSIDNEAAKSMHGEWAGVSFNAYDIAPRNYWRVSWNKGITEHVSSGSPLINIGSRMAIGYLSSGSSSCSNPYAYDFYGRFTYAWNTSNPSFYYPLGHYLDPQYSGTEILTSYIPNPQPAIVPETDPGGGNANTYPIYYGINFQDPSHPLGHFGDLFSTAQLCAGTYSWQVTHGSAGPSRGYCIGVSSASGLTTTGIKTDFNFIKDREYVLSIKVHNRDYNNYGADKLTISLGNRPPNLGGCGNMNLLVPTAYLGQNIMVLASNKFDQSYEFRKWVTYAIKFIPSDNFNHIYLHVSAKPNQTGALWLDNIYIHENGNFTNPRFIDEKIISDESKITSLERANNLVVFEKNSSKSPIIAPGKVVTAISHQVVLKDGFHAKYGSEFYARVGDCIDVTDVNNPIGPLEEGIVSNSFSGRLPTSLESTSEFIIDYSLLKNIHTDNKYPQKSVNSYANKSLMITPNPTKGKATLFLNSDCNDTVLKISTLQGKILRTIENVSDPIYELDLTGYSPGIYIIISLCNNKTSIGKIVIN